VSALTVGVSEVDRFHRSAPVIPVIGLGVAVVTAEHSALSTQHPTLSTVSLQHLQAAPSVDVRAGHDGEDGFWIVAGGDARCVIDMIAVARVEPHPVHRGTSSPDGYLVLRCIDELMALTQMVLLL
jgi:hypothetical protein